MLLRAITLKDELFTFEVKDCPVLINDTMLALTNLPGSPLLRAGTIARGDEETGIFESDIVLNRDNMFIGYVIYDTRFRVYNPNKDCILEFKDIEEYKVIENLYRLIFDKIGRYRSPIRLKDGDFSFNLSQMVRVDRGKITVFHKLVKSIYTDTTRFTTGLKCKGIEIAYGDSTIDGSIVLHNLCPCVLTDDNTYRDLREGEYDET